jgi:hypothetical protein
MSLQSDLIQFLIDAGTGVESRVHDEQVPQKVALPFLATSLLGGSQPNTLNGVRLFSRAQIRIAVFARYALERDTIEGQIRAYLNAWIFTHRNGGLIGNTRVISIRISRSSDDVAFSDGDNLVKGAGLDLSFMYQE